LVLVVGLLLTASVVAAHSQATIAAVVHQGRVDRPASRCVTNDARDTRLIVNRR
jgi:hypothetical protein